MEINDDNSAVEGIKEKSRPAYIKAWAKLRLFQKTRWSLKVGYQCMEQELLIYFRHLRTDVSEHKSPLRGLLAGFEGRSSHSILWWA